MRLRSPRPRFLPRAGVHVSVRAGARAGLIATALVPLTLALTFSLAACSVSDLAGDPAANTGTLVSPDAVKNADGALAFYRGAVTNQAVAIVVAVQSGGLLSDELVATGGMSAAPDMTFTDMRQTTEESGGSSDLTRFTELQHVRAVARQGRGVLAAYAPTAPAALTGHLYAIEGMADVLLAELYCSGIPLSTVNPDGTTTLAAGSTSAEVYQAAVALFDSALTLAGDSMRIANFARVGKARALLDLGQFDSAAAAAVPVPTDFQYLVRYASTPALQNGFMRPGLTQPYTTSISVMNNEGLNGLPFGTDGDWRTDTAAVTLERPDGATLTPRAAAKYDASGTTPIILASGVEARLIEAEADLKAGGSQWLTILNDLRATCTPGSACSPVLVSVPNAAPLPSIVDPVEPAARLDTLFAERAAWLYLTGHRQGDLRRLVRQYHRAQNTVYPSGLYPYLSQDTYSEFRTYGGNVDLPVPPAERDANPKYSGCLSRGA